MTYLKPLLFNLLSALPTMGLNSEQGTIQQFRDTNPVFITWSVSQGIFEKVAIPKELRHILIEYASREYVASRQKCVREIFMINVSLSDILFLNKDCLQGIKILNDAKANQRYDQTCKATKINFKITQQDYENTLTVPLSLKLKFLQENIQNNNWGTISARVLVYPDLTECDSIAYQDYCLAYYPPDLFSSHIPSKNL